MIKSQKNKESCYEIGDKIIFNGESYPYVTIDVNDTPCPYYIIVSVEALEKKLLDDNYNPIDRVAEDLDSRIAYYVENEEMLNLPDDVLLKQIYE